MLKLPGDCLHNSHKLSMIFLYQHKVNFYLIFTHSKCHLLRFLSLKPCIRHTHFYFQTKLKEHSSYQIPLAVMELNPQQQ